MYCPAYEGMMAKKKKHASLIERLERTVSDMADAASVAATGSQIGVLELAAEDELGIKPTSRKRKANEEKAHQTQQALTDNQRTNKKAADPGNRPLEV
jgi:phage terminase small subunit